jgi:cytochrome c-type biogenesis protein CcmH
MNLRFLKTLLLCLAFVLIAILPVVAQNVVTDDEVNAIAKKLYCPVCENIPLDTCGTAACDDWRYEIRLQLQDGKTEQQIVDDFVRRFGDRVVGTPQDPLLHAIAVIAPWMGVGLALILALVAALRMSRNKSAQKLAEVAEDDKYQSMLEKDLAG